MHVTKNNEASSCGTLYVCSTPIGNLSDCSERLLQTLRDVDVIACEDTRHSRKLLTHFEIHHSKLVSYHEHNEETRQHTLLTVLASGQSVALVSDAGTPLLSDPGRIVVDSAIEAGIPVVPLPGPSAVLAALVGSGLPLTPFMYLGFPPRQKRGVEDWLSPFRGIPATFVLYESPHRLAATLKTLAELLGDRPTALAKELTKRHETFARGTLYELVQHVETEGARGEYVVVIDNRGNGEKMALERGFGGNASANVAEHEDVPLSDEERFAQAVEYVKQKMDQGERHKAAVDEASTVFRVHRRTLYNDTLGR